MRDNDHDDLDALIDDTARSMTAGTPSPSLRASVRRRIERPAPALWNWRVGLAAASMVLVAFVAGRGWLSVPGGPERPRTAVEQIVATAPAGPAAGAPAPPALEPVGPSRASRVAARRVAPQVVPIAPAPIEIEPLVLESVDPMVLAVDTIAPPMPLDIMPIVVEPISQE